MNLAIPLVSPQVKTTLPMSALDSEARLGNGRLHGKSDRMDQAAPLSKEELPWHLHLARYIALGMSLKDAATACDCDPQTVSRLLRAPWFAERVNEYATEGSEDIMAVFKGSSTMAGLVLIEIAQDPKNGPTARISACKEILDRHLGKSVQHVEITPTEKYADPVARVKQLEEDIARRLSPASTVISQPANAPSPDPTQPD